MNTVMFEMFQSVNKYCEYGDGSGMFQCVNNCSSEDCDTTIVNILMVSMSLTLEHNVTTPRIPLLFVRYSTNTCFAVQDSFLYNYHL